MSDLRIFSYLPNPRLAKAMIAARFSGASIDVIGDKPPRLLDWLWDFDARPIAADEKETLAPIARSGSVGFSGVTLYKSDRFLAAHPFGNVPAGFSADGETGIFESNSIMRAAARCGDLPHGLLGDGPLGESRVDSFLDRSLVFACTVQRYLLADAGLSTQLHGEMKLALHGFAAGLETALQHSTFFAGSELTLADIGISCDLCQLTYESGFLHRLDELNLAPLLPELADYPALGKHIARLASDQRFEDEIGKQLGQLLAVWG